MTVSFLFFFFVSFGLPTSAAVDMDLDYQVNMIYFYILPAQREKCRGIISGHHI